MTLQGSDSATLRNSDSVPPHPTSTSPSSKTALTGSRMLSVSNIMADIDLPWIVMKFGGTSVGNAERLLNVAGIVGNTIHNYRPVLVCSAMSSQKKSEGTTSRLLRAAEETLIPNSKLYLDIIDIIERDHLQAATEAIFPDSVESTKLLNELINDVKKECNRLKEFLKAVEVIDEISPRSKDLIVSMGEKLSCRILTAVLNSRGVDAHYVNLERLINKEFEENNLDQTFYDYIAERASSLVREIVNEGGVPVVTGFFGPVPGSLLSSIGRGYTDLCAALIAVGLSASELQIWKEVDGIFTADPRKVPTARLLQTISPDEAAELTYYGSEVIHPFTMDQVIRAAIPIRIKNTFNPSGPGTLIIPESSQNYPSSRNRTKSKDPLDDATLCTALPVALGSDAATFTHIQSPRNSQLLNRAPTAVTIKDSILVINIRSNRKSNSHGFLSSIFSILDRHGIVVDLITTSEIHVSMAVGVVSGAEIGEDEVPRTLEKVVKEFRRLGTVSLTRNQVILSLVGKHMRHMIGTAGKMFDTLAIDDVNIEMISQGASEINISCVISEKDSIKALRSVHDRLVVGGWDGSKHANRHLSGIDKSQRN
ncbi:aspartate kinase [Paraphysoderma sedebokerense]|nr:aspartate kinase [Paraphysoderma sedebokerense]